MTVIAWDGTKFVGDRLTDASFASSVTKVHRIHRHLVGGAGEAVKVRDFIKWFEEGAVAEDYPPHLFGANSHQGDGGFCVMVITPEGEIRLYEDSPNFMVIEDATHAIGSGAPFAMAVMELGHDAEKAVKVASELCTGCGRGFNTLTLV